MVRRSLLLVFAVLWAAASQAQVNIAPGTDIQSVIDMNAAGTTYVLQAGTHRMQSFTPKSGDTFRGELSGSTKLTSLNGSRVLDTWVQDGAVWYHAGQTQEGTVGSDPLDCQSTHPRCVYPEELFVNDVHIEKAASLVAMTATQWWFDYATDRIYLGFDPTGQTMETSVTSSVVIASGADNVTFEDLIVEQYANPNNTCALALGASGLGGEGWVADNIEARWNHACGIGNDTNTTTRNSYVHHNGQTGFTGAGTGVLIEDNEIAYNNIRAGSDTATWGFDPYWSAGGTKWVFTTGMIVRRNYAHHNWGPGLWTDIENMGCLYENNVSSDNRRSGIFHEVSYGCTFTGNTVERNGLTDSQRAYADQLTGCGIEVLSSPGGVASADDVEITQNTVRDNYHGICVADDTRNTGVDESIGGRCMDGCNLNVLNTNVHHNTIRQASSGDGGTAGGFEDAEADGFDGDGNEFANNTYCLSGTDYPAVMFQWDGDATFSVAQWQATGNDTTSGFTVCSAPPSRIRLRLP